MTNKEEEILNRPIERYIKLVKKAFEPYETNPGDVEVNIYLLEDAHRSQLFMNSVDQALTKLNPRERAVLEFRYGLFDGNTHTLKATGMVLPRHNRYRQVGLGVTRERVREIEARALRKLRSQLTPRRTVQFIGDDSSRSL